MRILTRYLLRTHIGPFLFALSVLTGLLLINTVARRFEDMAGKGLPASVMAEVFVLSIPYTLALTLPMAVLVAVLYTFSTLTADNEVTALKASGVNLVRFLAPLLLAAIAVAGGTLWFNDGPLPAANHRLAGLLVDIASKSPTLEFEEQVINEIRAGGLGARYFLQAAQIDSKTNELRDVVIYDLSERGRGRTIYADSGQMAFNRERTDLFLTLHDGWVYEVEAANPKAFRRLFFDRQLVRLEGVGDQLDRNGERGYRTDREMSIAMLAAEVRQRQNELDEVRADARKQALEAVRQALKGPEERPGDGPRATAAAVPTAAASGPDHMTRRTANGLRTLEGRAEQIRQQISRYEVELHKKYSIPFASIVFVLIGAPLAIRFPRGGIGMVIAASLTIFTIYYMGLIGGEKLADEGLLDPFWAMWAPNVIFLGLGLWGMARIGREMSTTRGGGWDDLLRSLGGVAVRPLAPVRRRWPRRRGRPSVKPPGGHPRTGRRSAGQGSAGRVSAAQTPAGRASTAQASAAQASAAQASAEQASAEQASTGPASAEEASAEQDS